MKRSTKILLLCMPFFFSGVCDASLRNRLHRAVEARDMDAIKRFIREDDVNQFSLKKTPLQLAAEKGWQEIVELLIRAGADVNLPDKTLTGSLSAKKRTPLYFAVYGGHLAVVKVLLSKGANPNIVKWDKKSPLHRACEVGRREMVEALLSNGADKGLKGREAGRKDWTALDYAEDYKKNRASRNDDMEDAEAIIGLLKGDISPRETGTEREEDTSDYDRETGTEETRSDEDVEETGTDEGEDPDLEEEDIDF